MYVFISFYKVTQIRASNRHQSRHQMVCREDCLNFFANLYDKDSIKNKASLASKFRLMPSGQKKKNLETLKFQGFLAEWVGFEPT